MTEEVISEGAGSMEKVCSTSGLLNFVNVQSADVSHFFGSEF